jgi:hypothetical protein
VVVTQWGAVFCTKRNICDLPHDGSPTSSTLMSLTTKKKNEKTKKKGVVGQQGLSNCQGPVYPRMWPPRARFFSSPPSSSASMPSLMWAWPWMLGASDLARILNGSSNLPDSRQQEDVQILSLCTRVFSCLLQIIGPFVSH